VLDLNDVAIFTHVIRAGSFAAAAKKLGVAPNTLSRRVQLLEESLGTRLLVRSTRKLNMTPAGSLFFDQCAKGITEVEEAGTSLMEAATEPAGVVRVTAPVDFLEHAPVAWVAEFLARYPRVQVEFLLDDRKIDLVEESIDVALRGGKLEGATLVARRLFDSRRALFASPAFIAKRGTPATAANLEDMDCVTAPSVSGTTVWHLQGPEGIAEATVTGSFRANTAQAQAHAVRAGLGIGLLPKLLVQQDVIAGTMVPVLPEFEQDSGGMYVVSPSRRLRSPAVIALIEFFTERMRTTWASK
jgi:DNA-binding transcriptional LysR family regulator